MDREVLDLDAALFAEHVAAGFEHDVHIARTGEHAFGLKTVVADPAMGLEVDLADPDVLGAFKLHAEKGTDGLGPHHRAPFFVVHPELFQSPGIARQRDVLGGFAVQRIPVQVNAGAEQTRGGLSHRQVIILFAVQRVDHVNLGAEITGGRGRGSRQGGVRAHFEEHVRAHAQSGFDAVLEQNRLTQVAPAIVDVEAGFRLAGHGRDPRSGRHRPVDFGHFLAEPGLTGLKLVRVPCGIDLQDPDEGVRVVLLELLHELVQRVVIARNRGRAGAVDRGDVDLFGQHRFDVFGIQTHGRHRAFLTQLVADRAALGQEARSTLQRQAASGIGRAGFPDRVTDDHVGLHAPGFPHGDKAMLDREQSGLGDGGVVDAAVGFVLEDLGHDRPASRFHELGVVFFDGRAEGGVVFHQLTRHAPPLGALTGIHEGDFLTSGSLALIDVARILGVGIGAGDKVEALEQFVLVLGDNGGAIGVMGAVRGQSGGDFGQVGRGKLAIAQTLGQLGGDILDHGFGTGRNREDARRFRGWKFDRLAPDAFDRLVFGAAQQSRGVRATKTERVHDTAALALDLGEVRHIERHFHVERVKRNARIALFEPDLRRDFALVNGKRQLDQTVDAGTGFQVADVGLDRTDQQLAVGFGLTDNTADGAGFDRVANGRAGAVCFDIADVVCGDASADHQRLHHLHLAVLVRRRDGRGKAVLVGPAFLDHRIDAVAVCQSAVVGLERDGADAFATDKAVGFTVKGAQRTRRRQHPGL